MLRPDVILPASHCNTQGVGVCLSVAAITRATEGTQLVNEQISCSSCVAYAPLYAEPFLRSVDYVVAAAFQMAWNSCSYWYSTYCFQFSFLEDDVAISVLDVSYHVSHLDSQLLPNLSC